MKTQAVHVWPGATPTPLDGLFVILIKTSGAPGASISASASMQRNAARSQLRLATREALAAVLQIAVDDISIISEPGAAPQIIIAGRASRIGCSFSHEDDHSLAAINLHGRIGADLMRVQDIPDWQAVARDYLGPHVCAALQAATDSHRAFAFTQAWTRREAALKYQQQQISEWSAEIPGSAISLVLPTSSLVGHLHIGDNST
jgi:4'-phosphopantetheinyl transferase